MTHKTYLILIYAFTLSILSCENNDNSKKEEEDDDDIDLIGYWEKSVDFSGDSRGGATSFVINNKVYVGLGFGTKYTTFNDFKKFDGKEWTDVPDFPGEERYGAVAFTIGNKAYVGTGFTIPDQSNPQKYLKDFYCFDSDVNEWEKIEDFPGEGRSHAIAFGLNGYGYIGTGRNKDTAFNDFYRFNPNPQNGESFWTKLRSAINEPIYASTCFILENKAYICLGLTIEGSNNLSIVEFNPNNENFTRRKSLPLFDDEDIEKLVPRSYATSFVSNRGEDGLEYAYITLGLGSNNRTTFRYDARNDSWQRFANIPEVNNLQYSAVGFTLDGYGYYSTGAGSPTISPSVFTYNSTYKFIPKMEDNK